VGDACLTSRSIYASSALRSHNPLSAVASSCLSTALGRANERARAPMPSLFQASYASSKLSGRCMYSSKCLTRIAYT
jgi:hypothetical protein